MELTGNYILILQTLLTEGGWSEEARAAIVAAFSQGLHTRQRMPLLYTDAHGDVSLNLNAHLFGVMVDAGGFHASHLQTH